LAIAALSFAGSASAKDIFVQGVMTDCSNPNQPSAHPLPGENAKAAGENYVPISNEDSALALSVADQIFGQIPGKISEVNVIYLYGTTASHEQWRKQGVWPVKDLRANVGSCTVAPAQSLGKRGGTSFAYVDVVCAHAKDPWSKMRLAVAMADSEVSTICLNVGDPASLALPAPKGNANG